jgi:hypothetical protein
MTAAVAAVVGLAAVALAAAGCGVQPTGVHIADAQPFGAAPTTSAESVSPSQYPYTVSVFLFSEIIKGPGTMVTRPATEQLGPMDLPKELAELSGDERAQQYTTYVPAGIVLKQTNQAHMYIVYSPTHLGHLAQQQLYCTFDQWWLQHPDNHNPSTRLVLQDTGEDTGWQECKEGVVGAGAADLGAAKPSGATPLPVVGR